MLLSNVCQSDNLKSSLTSPIASSTTSLNLLLYKSASNSLRKTGCAVIHCRKPLTSAFPDSMKRFAILRPADIFDELWLDPATVDSGIAVLVIGFPSEGLSPPGLAYVDLGQYDPGFVLSHLLTMGSSLVSNSKFSL